MYVQTADLRNVANNFMHDARDVFNHVNKKFHRAASQLTKQASKTYPVVLDNLGNISQNTAQQTKSALSVLADNICSVADNVGVKLRSAESAVLKVGIVYMVYRVFFSDSSNTAVTKVRTRIHERPIESALIGLGVGYLLGKALR